MPAFSKANFISSLPIISPSRRFSEDSARAGQLVHPSLNQFQKRPTRSEHIVAILAHSRGELGTGCERVASGKRCEFSDTIILMTLLNGVRVVAKCTNCHFASDSKVQCGAVPANGAPASNVSSAGAHLGLLELTTMQEAMEEEGIGEEMEREEEPQHFALPGHIRNWVAEQVLQNEQSRATAELTAENVDGLPAFSEHSFEVPSNDMSLTDPESSEEMEGGEEDKAAEKERREVILRSFNHREQAVRRAMEIGLEKGLAEINTEREEYLASSRTEGRR